MATSRIKRIREMRRFTQEYMAAQLGVAQCTYSRLERGDVSIDQARLQRVADLLHVRTSDLIGNAPLMFIVWE